MTCVEHDEASLDPLTHLQCVDATLPRWGKRCFVRSVRRHDGPCFRFEGYVWK